jgi:cytoskeletal protein CcmA (bactofilin family)
VRRPLALLFVLVVSVALLSGVAAADTRLGGTVVVESGETTSDVSATGGTVVVRGTVDGDLRAYGGDVRIEEGAEVTGVVRVYGGEAHLNGTVGGNAFVVAGEATLGETASVDRSFGAVGGDVRLAGAVGGDANLFAGSVELAESALVEGDLTYRGEFVDDGTVEGVTQRTDELALLPPLEPVAFLFGVFLFVGNLLLGGILLAVAPRFAEAGHRTAVSEPLRTGASGLVAVGGAGVVVGLLAVSIVGLPLAVALLSVAVVLAWVAAVYGRYVVGAWLLSFTDRDSRYLALVIGVVLVALLGTVPVVGRLLSVVVFLLGAGIVALGLYRLRELVSENRGGLVNI